MAKAKLQWMESEEAFELNEDVIRTACLERLDNEWLDGSVDWDSLDSTLHRYEGSWH